MEYGTNFLKQSEMWKDIKPRIGEMLMAVNNIETQAEKAQEEAYQRGLSDAWEAARKIYLPVEYGGIPADALRQIFNNKSASGIFKKVSASEAVEKIRQYEQGKEEKQHAWICSEVGEPSTDTTLICSKCGYTITLKLGDTQALNFCPKCGDCKIPEETNE